MQHRAFRSGHTFIGHAPAPSRNLREEEEEERTVRGVFLGVEAEEVRTLRGFFAAPGASEPETDRVVLTSDMVEELRRRLREAEAREGSGVRLRPAPEDEELELDIEVEEPPIEELERISPLPVLEVALAPNSDSNFYAGFDEDHPTGVFLATYSRLPIGAPAYLDVHLPAGHRFRVAAIVEWIRPPEAASPGAPAGLGFAMCGLDDGARRLIRSFVRHRKPIFYEA